MEKGKGGPLDVNVMKMFKDCIQNNTKAVGKLFYHPDNDKKIFGAVFAVLGETQINAVVKALNMGSTSGPSSDCKTCVHNFTNASLEPCATCLKGQDNYEPH